MTTPHKTLAVIEKAKALIQCFVQLERTEHLHWCPLEYRDPKDEQCKHRYYAWNCSGVWCAGREHAPCADCIEHRKRGLRATAIQLTTIAILLFIPGCGYERRVQAFNQRHYDACVKKHGGETWVDRRTRLPLTCKALTFPSCEPGLTGEECGQ